MDLKIHVDLPGGWTAERVHLRERTSRIALLQFLWRDLSRWARFDLDKGVLLDKVADAPPAVSSWFEQSRNQERVIDIIAKRADEQARASLAAQT